MVLNINLKYLPMKAHFFCFNAATAPIMPFLPVMARQIGFTATIIGMMYTFLPICGMLIKPLMGGLADKYHKKKFIFILFEVICIFVFLPINFIPKIPIELKLPVKWNNTLISINTSSIDKDELYEKVSRETGTCTCEVQCSRNQIVRVNDQSFIKFIVTIDLKLTSKTNDLLYLRTRDVIRYNSTDLYLCAVECSSEDLNEYLGRSNKEKNISITGYYQFWTFGLLVLCAWISMAVIISIGDAICFELLDGNVYLYGRQRMWDSIASGLFSMVGGLMIDAFSKNKPYKNYTPIFLLMLGMMILDITCSARLTTNQRYDSASIAKDILKLLGHFHIIVFIIWCLFNGMCTALVVHFLFLYIEDLAKYSESAESRLKTLEGLVMGIQCLGGELPFFFISGWILQRLGHIHCMTLVLFCVGIRFLLYAVTVNPWWILPIEFSNGITYGLYYATMVSYASLIAPPGTEATMQSLVGSMYEGFGQSMGSLIGGILIDHYGSPKAYLVFSICAFICGVLHIIVQIFIKKHSRIVADINLDDRSIQVEN